jgi:predicted transcriptional regulator
VAFVTLSVALTPRRQEALQALQRLSAQAGGAVHYSLVAARMKISAWTAYSLLRELERTGLVARSYVRTGTQGRSRALFAPAASALVATAPDAGLEAAFRRFAAIADETAAARDYLAAARGDLAYHLGFWLGRAQAAGRQASDAARTLLEGGGRPAAKIQAVAALGLGTAIARLEGSRLAARLTRASVRFNALLEEGTDSSETSLAALVDAARSLEAAP